ncbi:MAG: hypothetical protein IPP19_12385 [Verrucomicrobia bacterium]|nr:hypothetical protein [Verrucomicrobiota bacterium]
MMTKPRNGNNVPLAAAWLAAGILLLVGAWMVPVNLKSVTPSVLKQAGKETPSVAVFGKQILDSEKLGPAQLVLAAARLVDDPKAPLLDRSIRDVITRRPEWAAWGGWDPFLEPLFNLKENTGRTESTPVLTFFIATKARQGLLTYLSNTRSLGVQAVLQTREIDRTTQFVPAKRPGGQALDAVILLTALLYQGDHLSGSLQRELRNLAETAATAKQMGELESFYVDLLSLGKRLDWVQLRELLRTTDSTKTMGEYAHLARLAPDNLPLIYTAALFSDSADRVASYLIKYGKTGLEDLRLALALGQGAVRQLMLIQSPINRKAGPALGLVTEFALLYPRVTLAVKYLGFLVGAFCLFRGLQRELIEPRSGYASPLRVQSSILAVLTAFLLILATEPFLLKAAPPSEFRLKFVIPILSNTADVKPPTTPSSVPTMDTKIIGSIIFFAALQVGMYLFCLRKIREISRSNISPLVKLRLMENEENLFDGGLYIGIGGTAMALVLQVLGLVPANLLAAYSSNLFGITCVALVKIRHVRPYKRQLILDTQAPAPAMPASLVAAVPPRPQVAVPAATAKVATPTPPPPPPPPAAPTAKSA